MIYLEILSISYYTHYDYVYHLKMVGQFTFSSPHL